MEVNNLTGYFVHNNIFMNMVMSFILYLLILKTFFLLWLLLAVTSSNVQPVAKLLKTPSVIYINLRCLILPLALYLLF